MLAAMPSFEAPVAGMAPVRLVFGVCLLAHTNPVRAGGSFVLEISPLAHNLS
jgi:hypothetical protein